MTDKTVAEPNWGARRFPKDVRAGNFVTLASGFAEDQEALKINAAARVMGATLRAGETAELDLDQSRNAYLVAVGGANEVNDARAEPRAGIAIPGAVSVHLKDLEHCEVVLAASCERQLPTQLTRARPVGASSSKYL